MTSISVSGASAGWASSQVNRQQQHQQRMFAKVDSDGSGAVSASEFDTMLSDIGSKTGSSLGDSGELFSRMDSDGDGSLSSDELQQGMKSLLPPPSTMDFAQARGVNGQAGDDLFSKIDADGDGSLNGEELQAFTEKMSAATGQDMSGMMAKLDTDGDGSLSQSEFDAGRPSGPPPGGAGVQGAGGPPPMGGPGGVGGAGGAGGASASGDSSGSYDPLDANQDGVVSQMERLVGKLKELVSSDSQDGVSSDVTKLVQKLYDQISRSASSASTSQISVTA